MHVKDAEAFRNKGSINLNPTLVLLVLVAISALLAVAHFATYSADSTLHSEQLLRISDVDEEESFPTWFSSTQLFAASCLLLLIGLQRRANAAPYANHWLILSVLFLGMSIEEIIALHEVSNDLIGLD